MAMNAGMLNPAAMQQMMMDQVLTGALQSVEAAVDDELDRFENLTEDDYAKIKAKRMAEMKKKAEEKIAARGMGHGTFSKIVEQKEFFEATKQSGKVIALFTRDSNKYGTIMREHMTLLAQRHLECRFVWVDAENAPFLTEKLNIWMLPTIVCIKDNKVDKQHNGLNEIDGSGKYTSGMLEYLLHIDGMLDEAPLYEQEQRDEEEELADSDED